MEMNRLTKTAAAALMVGVLFVTVPGCQKQEGPVERAGKEVDKTVEQIGQQIEKAGDGIQDAAKDAKK